MTRPATTRQRLRETKAAIVMLERCVRENPESAMRLSLQSLRKVERQLETAISAEKPAGRRQSSRP